MDVRATMKSKTASQDRLEYALLLHDNSSSHSASSTVELINLETPSKGYYTKPHTAQTMHPYDFHWFQELKKKVRWKQKWDHIRDMRN